MVKKMQEEFYRLSNQSQAAFAKKLTPTNIAFLGIKIPQIKEFVKSHAITYDELYHIKLNQYVEQDILFGLFLNKLGKVKNELYYRNIGKPRTADRIFRAFMGQLPHGCCCVDFPVLSNKKRIRTSASCTDFLWYASCQSLSGHHAFH